ncbi:flavodoxin family protein [Mycoplasmatota bacterium WC44]
MILILNGSPNKSGQTIQLINTLVSNLDEEYIIINAYELDIIPCTDCKYCDKLDGCSKKDDMDEVYDLLKSSNKLIIASPLYFATISSKLLDIITRFQTYFAKKFVRKGEVLKIEKSLLICTAGGEWPTMFNGPIETMKVLNMLFSIDESKNLLVRNTDNIDSLETDVTEYTEFMT